MPIRPSVYASLSAVAVIAAAGGVAAAPSKTNNAQAASAETELAHELNAMGEFLERLNDIEAMIDRGAYTDALRAQVMLWRDSRQWIYDAEQPGMIVSIRHGNLVAQMDALARTYPPANRVYQRLFEDVNARTMSGSATALDVTDWVALELKVFKDTEAVLKVVDLLEQDAEGRLILMSMKPMLLDTVVDAERWTTIGLFAGRPDPAVVVASAEASLDASKAAGTTPAYLSTLRHNQAIDHAGMLALGRDAAAWASADALIAMLDTVSPEEGDKLRMQLVATALRAGQVRPRHLEMLGKVASVTEFPAALNSTKLVRLDDLRGRVVRELLMADRDTSSAVAEVPTNE